MAKKIVVIDDSAPFDAKSAASFWGGIRSGRASDGVEGAEIDANADAAMVICDVNMPRMNGIEMLSFLKKEPKHGPLTVIMLTTEGQPRLIARLSKLGPKDGS